LTKHFLSISDFSLREITEILDSADELKKRRSQGKTSEQLRNKTLAMIFEKPSTRTRVSFEAAMTELGGHAIYLNWNDLQLGRGETIQDTSAVISRYVNAIMARVYRHETLEELARHSKVPVINGLSDLEHPCQLLADLQTIREYKGKLEGLRFVWIGDGNNVCNSTILASAITGMNITVACPEGYEPNKKILEKAKEMGAAIEIINDPEAAAKNADIIYTDVWVSMGQEDEREERMQKFKGYQVNSKLLEQAKRDVMIMHCLPAHRGEEITSEVVDGPSSAVLDQAENRLHTQKALLLKLIK